MRLSKLSCIVPRLDHCVLQKTVPCSGRLASTSPVNGGTILKPQIEGNTSKPVIPELVGENSTTVDSADIELHSAQHKLWWDPQGIMKPLHAMNLVRIPFVRDGLIHESEPTGFPLKGKKVLDIGCGGGILSEGLARIGAEVTGIDASEELINLAKKHSELDPKIANNRPNYIYTSVEEHVKSHKDYYDGVVASEVIEHVNNKELFIQASVDTLKPGGRIFFTTPNRTRIGQLTGIFLAEYILKILPKGTHQYEKFITPPELTFLLERKQCHVESIQGLFYRYVTNQWEWVNTQAFVFALQAQKLDTTEDVTENNS